MGFGRRTHRLALAHTKAVAVSLSHLRDLLAMSLQPVGLHPVLLGARGKDVFVHSSQLDNLGGTLNEGQTISFEARQGQKGLEAVNVSTD